MYAQEMHWHAPLRVCVAPKNLDAAPEKGEAGPENADAALVASLIAGDQRAWRAFHDVHSPSMLEAIAGVRSRFSHIIGADDVRDIHAELCLQLLANDKRRLRQFDPSRGTPLAAWLGVLARHAAFDFLRLRRRQPTVRWKGEETTHLEAVRADTPDALDLCCSRERGRIVAALVAELSARDREFFELHFYEGLDPEQTAERLGICVGTVYSKKHKIRARIESLLGKRLAA
jgi:RNA polymerase sigma-70 factor, ECF subfamily